jgi:hypothetical protein
MLREFPKPGASAACVFRQQGTAHGRTPSSEEVSPDHTDSPHRLRMWAVPSCRKTWSPARVGKHYVLFSQTRHVTHSFPRLRTQCDGYAPHLARVSELCYQGEPPTRGAQRGRQDDAHTLAVQRLACGAAHTPTADEQQARATQPPGRRDHATRSGPVSCPGPFPRGPGAPARTADSACPLLRG